MNLTRYHAITMFLVVAFILSFADLLPKAVQFWGKIAFCVALLLLAAAAAILRTRDRRRSRKSSEPSSIEPTRETE